MIQHPATPTEAVHTQSFIPLPLLTKQQHIVNTDGNFDKYNSARKEQIKNHVDEIILKDSNYYKVIAFLQRLFQASSSKGTGLDAAPLLNWKLQ